MRKRYDILRPATARTRPPARRSAPGIRTAALLRRILAKYRLRARADGFAILYRLNAAARPPRAGDHRSRVSTPANIGPLRIQLAFSTQVFHHNETIQHGSVIHYGRIEAEPNATTTIIDSAPSTTSTEPRVRDLLRTPPEIATTGATPSVPPQLHFSRNYSRDIRISEFRSRRTAAVSGAPAVAARLQMVTLRHNSPDRAAADQTRPGENETLAFEPLAKRLRDPAAPARPVLREPLELVIRRAPAGGARTQNESGNNSGEFTGNRNGSTHRTAPTVQSPVAPEKPRAADLAEAVRKAVRDLSAHEIGSLTEKVVRHLERQIRREMDRRGLK